MFPFIFCYCSRFCLNSWFSVAIYCNFRWHIFGISWNWISMTSYWRLKGSFMIYRMLCMNTSLFLLTHNFFSCLIQSECWFDFLKCIITMTSWFPCILLEFTFPYGMLLLLYLFLTIIWIRNMLIWFKKLVLYFWDWVSCKISWLCFYSSILIFLYLFFCVNFFF